MNSFTSLAGKFFVQSASNVEYSMDDRPFVQSFTLPPGSMVRTQVEETGAAMRFGGTWALTVDRLIEEILPNAMLLRFDTRQHHLLALTAYLRFRQEPGVTALTRLLAHASRLRVDLSFITPFTAVINCRGPRGLSIRGDDKGGMRLALYFKIQRDMLSFPRNTLKVLLQAWDWNPAIAEQIAGDLRMIYPGGSVGIIGIDVNETGQIDAIKFDPANVSIERTAAFLRTKNASQERIKAFYEMTRALRALSLSYLGVKYTPHGFAGWRLYFSCRSSGNRRAVHPSLFIDSPGSATLRLPHY